MSDKQCKNCDHPLEADHKFCPNCGQDVQDSAASLSAFFTHFLNDYFTFDSKIVRSFTPLITKPGFLTEEFLKGRRVRYITPLRMYIFVSIVFFLVLSLLGDGSEIETEEVFWDVFFGNYLPKIFFGLLPLFALILYALYWRRKEKYVKHFVFSLHFHAFLFLITLAFILIGELFDLMHLVIVNQILSGLVTAAFVVYLFFSMKKVYGQSIGKTLLKLFLLLLTYTGVLVVIVTLALLLLTSSTP